jgi:beta-carotene/zeaxanthin 4-ketolase
MESAVVSLKSPTDANSSGQRPLNGYLTHVGKKEAASGRGVAVGALIVVLWGVVQYLAFKYPFDLPSNLQDFTPLSFGINIGIGGLFFLLLSHLYTGLFITAHDSMHGLVSANKRLNAAMGTVTAGLFAFNYYPVLLAAHHRHHRNPASTQDPDYHRGDARFLPWYLAFVRQYLSLWQILAMAITFNVLKIWLPVDRLIIFWMLPSIASTFQLFYFGTYLPHRGEHAETDRHRARSQRSVTTGDHIWAFVTCYFFGYHHEHHNAPWLPWYRLPTAVPGGKKSA